MTCERIQDSLFEHLHRELPRAEQRSVAEHLAGCADCALEYCRLDAELSGLVEALEVEPPAALEAALLARVQATFRRPWWRRALAGLLEIRIPAYQAAMLSALSVALVVAGLWLVRGGASGGLQPGAGAAGLEARPRPATSLRTGGGRRPSAVLLEAYDSSTPPSIAPNLL
jgi:anti-sigma factor RsiW